MPGSQDKPPTSPHGPGSELLRTHWPLENRTSIDAEFPQESVAVTVPVPHAPSRLVIPPVLLISPSLMLHVYGGFPPVTLYDDPTSGVDVPATCICVAP
jgi:hypothetical protein